MFCVARSTDADSERGKTQKPRSGKEMEYLYAIARREYCKRMEKKNHSERERVAKKEKKSERKTK